MIDTLLRLLDMLVQYVVREGKNRESGRHAEQVAATRADPQAQFADRFDTGVYGNLDPIAMPGDAAEPAECDLRTGPHHHP
jgi:hypothetical protein